MPPIHQFKITSGTLESDLVVAIGRTQVLTIAVSNDNLTQAVFVGVEDKDGNTLFKIVVPAADSRSVTFAEPTDFVSGLTICGLSSNGNLVRVVVSHSRNL